MKENTPLFNDYLKSKHPQMQDEPSYDLVLTPEDEQKFRARAQAYGFDYDEVKRDFLLSHQIISPREHQEAMKLIDKNAIPVNKVRDCFHGYIEGEVGHVEWRREQEQQNGS